MDNLWRRRSSFGQESLHVCHLAVANVLFSRTDNGPFESIKKKKFDGPQPPDLDRQLWMLESPDPGTQVFIQDGLKPSGA